MSSLSKNLRIAALALMGLYSIFFLVVGVGKMAGGDKSGSNNLLAFLIMAAMMYVAWKRPRIAGILLLGIGLVAGIYFLAIFSNSSLGSILIMSAAPLVAGLLLLSIGLIEKKPI